MPAVPLLPAAQITYILIAGFSLGIIAYNIVLFRCTRETIYLHFSAALFSYILGVTQWISPLYTGIESQDSILLVDTLNLVLFSSFFKHLLILLADFKSKHPLLTKAFDIATYSGISLILIHLLHPHPLLYTVEKALVAIACTIPFITIFSWYDTLKHLHTFFVTFLLFLLFTIYTYTYTLFYSSTQISHIIYNFWILSCTLIFLSFSTLISSRLNNDRKLREDTQQKAIENLTKYRQLYDRFVDGLFTARYDGILLASNPALNSLLAIDHLSITQYSVSLQTYFLEQQTAWQKIIDLLRQKEIIENLEIQGLNHSWYSLSARLIKTGDEAVIEGSLTDISERKLQALELAYLARHDPLTKLFNRTEFEQRLQETVDHPQQQALLFIDLDQFKVINDTCGHPAGDECLRQIALLLQELVSEHETLARLGGDEFAVLLQHHTEITPKVRAEHIRYVLESYQFIWNNRLFRTTVSIGVITIGSEVRTVAQALSLADTACYAAKEAGRNCIVMGDPKCNITMRRHNQMEMVATLNRALKDDLFVLYRQAVIPLHDNISYLPQYELLLRLYTQNGIQMPGAFLPAAQRYDLLPQIDRWVIKTACGWLANRTDHPQAEILNINLSPQTLSHPNFISYVCHTLKEYAIPPQLICFEITEYNAINDLTQVLRQLHQLQDLGIRFALDDFGSGFASYDYVKRLPVDFIKIDGQFVREINRNIPDRTMVQAITDIARSLGKQIIAESVEDREIAETLRILGVDYGQGYFLGKPEPLIQETNHIDAYHKHRIQSKIPSLNG